MVVTVVVVVVVLVFAFLVLIEFSPPRQLLGLVPLPWSLLSRGEVNSEVLFSTDNHNNRLSTSTHQCGDEFPSVHFLESKVADQLLLG